MERNVKIFILVFGGVLVIGSVTLGLILNQQQKRREEEEEIRQQEEEAKRQEENNSNTGGSTSDAGQTTISDGKTHPTWNVEGELITPADKMIGKYLYPKRREDGGLGYSNIRSSAEVNTESAWYDPIDNFITTINAGVVIGRVVSETAGVYNGYSYRWFRVKLNKSVGYWYKTYRYGYVRADTVTHKPF